MNSRFSRFAAAISAIMYPRTCLFCETVTDMENIKIICPSCYENLPTLNPLLPPRLISKIEDRKFDDLFIQYEFDEQLQVLIHYLKYKRFLSVGKILVKKLSQSIPHSDYDFVCGVPLHKIKERERGYNQSDVIAGAFAKLKQIHFHKDCIARIKHTKSQTTLSRALRIQNMQNVFRVKGNVSGKKILLFDDVITTGSTLNACATEFKKNGATIVDVAVLATPKDILQRRFEKEIVNLNRGNHFF
jgi:ComF family protein